MEVGRNSPIARLSRLRRSGAVARTGIALFLRELWKNPAAAGAPWPSSRHLAKKMAERVPMSTDGLVVELGAGTGAVTQALLDQGVAPSRLLLVERSPALFKHLSKRFPELRIALADAGDLHALLPPDTQVAALVSSIPLRSLSFENSEKIVQHWREIVAPGTPLIQFTYALVGPLRHLSSRFALRDTAIAWVNFPPARVVTFAMS